ncbi:MAG: DUF1932 domain-containing protein [Pseudomonadota bacterium]
MDTPFTIGIVGYGEVGRILAEDLRAQGVAVHAHDVFPASAEHAARHGVQLAVSHAELAQNADMVFSAVTASQALAAASACAADMRAQAWFIDLNSASPGTKQRCAAVIEQAGGRYVEGAVMASVPPYRIKVPLLLGGPHAGALCGQLNQLGFAASVGSQQLGTASALKMCRSVMIKGMEAMVIESFTAARAYGVEDQLIASLQETFPAIDWNTQAAYFFQRVIQHGRRRSEEMREVAHTVREAGLEPWSASATAERQAWIAELFAANGERSADWRMAADCILTHVRKP